MVKGLELFRERFREFADSFTLIGGAACDEWFTSQGLPFRATKDLDIVLIIESLDPAFVRALRVFIGEGEYEIRQRTGGSPVLYRFAKPKQAAFPAMLELFSRKPDGLTLDRGQAIALMPAGAEQHSLSALLLNDDFYSLIQTHREIRHALPVATVTALIPLKAHAWLNLSKLKVAGAEIDSRDIAKHRNDVFRLAGTLPGVAGPALPVSIIADLTQFMEAFPVESTEWTAILTSVKDTLGGKIRPAALRSAMQTYFQLPP